MWTPAQTAAFLNAIRGHRLRAAYDLIALRGLHRGEACGLRWSDIDLDAATAATQRRRRAGWRSLRRQARTVVASGLSLAHPAWQIARPRHQRSLGQQPGTAVNGKTPRAQP